MSRSDSEIEHQGANLREQLQAIVNSEMDAFAGADRISEVSQLQDQVSHFMGSLQQRFDVYIHDIERENAKMVEESKAEAVAESKLSDSHELNDEDIMNLEKEFHTYGIKQANGSTENKKSSMKYKMSQSLVGATIAVTLMWVFWPASEQGEMADTVEQANIGTVKPVAVTKPEAVAVVAAPVIEEKQIAPVAPVAKAVVFEK